MPEHPEFFWFRRLITHPWFPPVCIMAALLIMGANMAARA